MCFTRGLLRAETPPHLLGPDQQGPLLGWWTWPCVPDNVFCSGEESTVKDVLDQGCTFGPVGNCSSLIKCKAHPLWAHSLGLCRADLAFSACFTINSSRKGSFIHWSHRSMRQDLHMSLVYKSWSEVIIFFPCHPLIFPSFLSLFYPPSCSFVFPFTDIVLSLETSPFLNPHRPSWGMHPSSLPPCPAWWLSLIAHPQPNPELCEHWSAEMVFPGSVGVPGGYLMADAQYSLLNLWAFDNLLSSSLSPTVLFFLLSSSSSLSESLLKVPGKEEASVYHHRWDFRGLQAKAPPKVIRNVFLAW